MEPNFLSNFNEFISRWLYDPVIGKLIFSIVGVIFILLFVRIIQNSVGKHITGNSARYRAKKIVSFIGYIAVFLFVATVFSDRLSKLTIAFGVAGAGIAFALQEVIASIAGWIAISFGHYYSTGDRVEMRGITGDVIDIGVLRTTLMETGQWVKGNLYNGRIVKVANSFVFKEPVFNFSADFPFLWDEIAFPIKYGSDWKYGRDTLRKIADEVCGDYAEKSKKSWRTIVGKYNIEEAKVEPMVTLTADQNWVEFTLRYVVDFRQRRTTKDRLFSRVLEEIDKSNGKIRIATSSLELSTDTSVDVKLVKN